LTSKNDQLQLFSITTSPDSNISQYWYLDSGATQHMTPERGWFTSIVPKARIVNIGDDSKCEMMGIGNISLRMPDGAHKQIQDVRYVPALAKTILSVSKITDAAIIAQFGINECVLKDAEGVTVAKGIRDLDMQIHIHLKH
jgi:hypothetical protein